MLNWRHKWLHACNWTASSSGVVVSKLVIISNWHCHQKVYKRETRNKTLKVKDVAKDGMPKRIQKQGRDNIEIESKALPPTSFYTLCIYLHLSSLPCLYIFLACHPFHLFNVLMYFN